MSRSVVLRMLAAAALAVLFITAIALWRPRSGPEIVHTPAADLDAPLPAESEADFAAAMPAIDELRHRRGSLLDGTLLADAPPHPLPADNSYVELLRREARRLDGQAADLEDQGWYDHADETRAEAERLRVLAREKAPFRPEFSNTYLDYERR
jgi:hypothetical protein